MRITPVPSIDFNKCQPARCTGGICVAIHACPHKAFVQEQPYDFPLHDASMCTGCGSCVSACPVKAIRMV
jgi:NAD-dependent dihydropyrimidine dehydrogenase PreA subunit